MVSTWHEWNYWKCLKKKFHFGITKFTGYGGGYGRGGYGGYGGGRGGFGRGGYGGMCTGAK